MKTLVKIFAGLAVACLTAVPALAQTKTLRVADSFPATNIMSRLGISVWMERVKELSGGAVDFQYFPAQQLGKATDMLRLVQTGVADITFVAPGYVSDRLPLSEVAALPGMFGSSCEGTRAYWQIAKPGSILDREEYAPNSIRPLFAVTLSPYQIFTSARDITSIKDIAGLKIRSGGGIGDLVIQSLGATPIKMAGTDAREALQRGTVDGTLSPFTGLKPYDFTPYAQRGTMGGAFGSFVVSYMINNGKWEELSEEIRLAMTRAGEELNESLCAAVDQESVEVAEELKAAGAVYLQFSEQDAADLAKAVENLNADWSKALAARGRPGPEVIEAYQQALGK